jgi:hypothetical protein
MAGTKRKSLARGEPPVHLSGDLAWGEMRLVEHSDDAERLFIHIGEAG